MATCVFVYHNTPCLKVSDLPTAMCVWESVCVCTRLCLHLWPYISILVHILISSLRVHLRIQIHCVSLKAPHVLCRYAFLSIHSTTHVMLDMWANTPSASDLMPELWRCSQPTVVEHVPSDNSWKAASSDKTQSPNVAICVLTLSL